LFHRNFVLFHYNLVLLQCKSFSFQSKGVLLQNKSFLPAPRAGKPYPGATIWRSQFPVDSLCVRPDGAGSWQPVIRNAIARIIG
jgi:hypothetical protein